MNYDTLGKALLIFAGMAGSIIFLYLFAKFITWKAFRDWEVEKGQKVLGSEERHIDIKL